MRSRYQDLTARLSARVQTLRSHDREEGMVPTEYALATAVGAGCVGLVYKIVSSEQVLEVLKKVILKKLGLY